MGRLSGEGVGWVSEIVLLRCAVICEPYETPLYDLPIDKEGRYSYKASTVGSWEREWGRGGMGV